MATILPLLLIVLCPIAMLLMMRGMHRHASEQRVQQSEPESPRDVAALRVLRNELESRIEDLDARIYELESSRPSDAA